MGRGAWMDIKRVCIGKAWLTIVNRIDENTD